MGADLFGSFAESTCAALVISSNTLFATNMIGASNHVVALQNLMFPLTMIAAGIIVCLITSAIGIYCSNVNQPEKVESTLKCQIIISTVLLIIAIYVVATHSYPARFVLIDVDRTRILTPLRPYICALLGLVSGMLIGGVTEYYTSHAYHPVR
jgi:Na+/H+-translocating membrane pyrophosphatase